MKKTMLLLLSAVTIISCSKDSVTEMEGPDLQENQISQDGILAERANPDGGGSVSEIYYAGQKLPVLNFGGDYVYQGDILLPETMVSQQPKKLIYEKGDKLPAQKSVGRTSDRWPDNTVYYAIDGSLEDTYRIYDAIEHWENNTNMNFVERSNQSNYVYFVTSSGCSSYIGMIGGRQNINVSPRCSTGNVIHEIGHAVGLWHEQSRADREEYITINYENIDDGMEYNFYTYRDRGLDGEEFTNALDFNSIMLYGSYAFSKNGEPTIVRKNGSAYSAQRNALSSGDISGISKMYPANTGGGVEEPVYINGEYYTVEGLLVYRMHDRWYYHSAIGWREIRLYRGFWYYA